MDDERDFYVTYALRYVTPPLRLCPLWAIVVSGFLKEIRGWDGRNGRSRNSANVCASRGEATMTSLMRSATDAGVPAWPPTGGCTVGVRPKPLTGTVSTPLG